MLQRIAAAVAGTAALGVLIGAYLVQRARADDVVWYKPMPGVVPAPATVFGLYRGVDFRLTTGACKDCAAPPQALWHFRDEIVAVPSNGVDAADYTRGLAAQDDVKRWYATATAVQLQARPPLLWIGATHQARHVQLTADDRLQFADGHSVPFGIVPRIKTNRAYYDASSKAFLRKRLLRLRGELRGQAFVARTLWPQDWAIDEKTLHPAPLLADETLRSMVRRHDSARHETFEARLLWERTPAATPAARDWRGRAVIGFLLNGAQGDDDEAHAGHFAVVTGRHAPGTDMADWIVNNFYDLGTYSEKGITAAMLPLDNYLGDVNSGQSWYRPSYLLVAVLANERAAHTYQAAIARVYNHFYRHDFRYHHARANCVGISMDTLRSLGWPVPLMGSSGLFKALAAYPYQAFRERSFSSGKAAYDYLTEEQTRLYPAAAYEAIGSDLLRFAREAEPAPAPAGANEKSLESLLRADLEALVFVRIPQIPSSRAFGSYPVASYEEYRKRVPRDKSQWNIVPLQARPFPAELLEPDSPGEGRASPGWTALLGTLLLAGLLFAALRRLRGRGTGSSVVD